MSQQNTEHNCQCTSQSHNKHLCYMISQGFNVSDKNEFEALINDPKFKCGHCGREANSDQNLCVPAELNE